MSRLGGRIERIERTLGSCPDCRGRAVRIELRNASAAPRRKPEDSVCPNCGETAERITVLVAFDPDDELEQV
jgi:hypothetical protein